VADLSLGERIIGLALSQLSNGSSQAVNQSESENLESPIQVENQNRDIRRAARKRRLNTNTSDGTRRAKK